jgi:hypothetical protein
LKLCIVKEGITGIEDEEEKEIIYIKDGKVEKAKESEATYCFKISFTLKGNEAYFNEKLRIPLPFSIKELNYLRVMYIALGKVKNDVYYFKNAEIHIEKELKEIKITKEEEIKFTRFCGNYGLLFPQYCIGNNDFSIFSRRKEDVKEAFEEFKKLLEEIRKNLLEISNYINQ